MGLYNMLFGVNKLSPLILATLGLKPSDMGRFRDCYIEDGKIAVYTRNGGGNRESYMPDFSANPHYLYDQDDDFDCTYATIYFKFPDEFAADLKAIESNTENHKPSDKWEALFASFKEGGSL